MVEALMKIEAILGQLVRFLPSGRKNQEAPDQLPRPPVLARQAVFLFLHRPGELSSENLTWQAER